MWLPRELILPVRSFPPHHSFPLLFHTLFPFIFWSSIQISLLLQPILFQCLEHSLLAPAPCLRSQPDSVFFCSSFSQVPPTQLTCSSVMDMISCQVNSISPSSRAGNCVTLFLLCWGGHGGILLGQGLVPGPQSPKGPSNLCQRRKRFKKRSGLKHVPLGASNFVLPPWRSPSSLS